MWCIVKETIFKFAEICRKKKDIFIKKVYRICIDYILIVTNLNKSLSSLHERQWTHTEKKVRLRIRQ